MGRSNIPLLDAGSVSDGVKNQLLQAANGNNNIQLLGWPVSTADLSVFISSLLFCMVIAVLLHRFLLTHFGTALRATGNNAQMVRALGINNHKMVVFSLALSNGLVALSGALLAQYQGFADVQMGIGMMVWGLASIIIGEALTGKSGIGITITGAILGTILFRLLIAIALRWGLNPNDLKLVTAVFVFAALVAPGLFKTISKKFNKSPDHA
jgi:putative tryptophan/tyrosine transport system permease protein